MSSLIEYDANQPLDSVASPSTGEGAELQTNLLALAWQARWLLLLTVLLGVTGSWLLLQRIVPSYTSTSRIYIERNMPQFLAGSMQRGTSSSYLYTQAELIRSTSVLAVVAESPENAQLESFRGIADRVGQLRLDIVVEIGQDDDIINVSTELPNANDAAQLVNSVVDAYISKYVEQRRTNTVEVLNILRDEKRRRDEELNARLKELETFRGQNAALAVQVGEENVISKRFATLAAELDRVELALLDAKARHSRTQQMFKSPSQRPFLLELASDKQNVAQDMRLKDQQQLDLENQIRKVDMQLNSLRATWGDGHVEIKLLLAFKAGLAKRLKSQQLAAEKRKTTIVVAYVETVAREYQLLQEMRGELQHSYDKQFELAIQVSSQATKLSTLEAALARTVRLVDILDERIKEFNLIEDVGAMNVSIMEVATPAIKPTSPSRSRILALGSLLGGLVGFGLAWLRDMMDHRLKSIDEIAAVLQLPVLGVLPLSEDKGGRHFTGRVVLAKPRSAAAESFRTLRTAIHFGLTQEDGRTITITSPSPGDGKSIVASNLAIAMAQADQRVLLIDADMRKPKQHEVFEISAERGLSAVLAERRPAAELILKTEIDSLDLLPCGAVPTNPVELLNNGFFSEFLQELLETYDKIIIDAPPIMPVADARVIAAQTDATIMVLRAERATRRLSVAARDELWRVRAQRLGVVVNAVPGRKQSSYSAGYGYGYGNYGGSYGSYGDVAYGQAEPPVVAGELKKSRTLPTQQADAEVVDAVDL